MFVKGSRYIKAQSFALDESGNEVFAGIRPRAIDPATGVIEHQLKAGDRLDLLARQYYNNDRLWWRIVDANPEILYGGDMELSERYGQVILIPKVRE